MNRKVIAYWIAVLIILSVLFGRSWQNPFGGLFVVTCLFPIVLVLAYTINNLLIPKFYNKGAYFKFGLYLTYLFIGSLYVQMWVILGALMYMANFDFSGLAPSVKDLILLSGILYLLVAISVFFLRRPAPAENKNIEIISNRKRISIESDNLEYLESLNSRVWMYLKDGESLETRQKLGALGAELPENFIRIHRSFIVNKNYVVAFDAEQLSLKCGRKISWGRAYKKEGWRKLT
ncbi:LytTR family transcriptional regulator [Flavobacteriaceae bacterium]|nr:LytTR family transcriptional regulator [Flavobacteriaceae bacterium]